MGRSCKTVKGSDKGSNRKKEVRNLTVSDFSVAAGEGFEPSHTESEEDMDAIVEQSHLVTAEEWEKRSVLRRVFEPLLRLFAIWM